MYCPECLTEYREGFIECADCRVPLSAGLPPESPPARHDLELVTVLHTTDTFALTLAKASLEEAGIEYMVNGSDPRSRAGVSGALLGGATPLASSSCVIQVAPESANKARELLAPLSDPDETPDIDAGPERPW